MAQLPIGKFLRERLTEFDPAFELRSGTGFEQLFFKPIQFIVQPLRDEAADIFTSQSFLRILLTDDPDAYNEEAVDDLASNLFVFRREGSKSSGVARVYFNVPVAREYPAGGAVFSAGNGLLYSNPNPFIITEAQMETLLSEGLYYFDIPIKSDDSGAETELEVDELLALAGDDAVVRVTNLQPVTGGLDRETNSEFINRVQDSIAVRDLVTGKGFNAIMFENFQSNLLEVQPVGFGDGEMMRDIVYNAHIGGKVDGWVKTSKILSKSSDFIGVLADPTRQQFASINVALNGISWANLKNKPLDRTGGLDPIVKEIKPSYPGQYISTVNTSAPLNLSVSQHIKIGIDGEFRNIKISGVVASATTRNEIVSRINIAFGRTVAFPSGNFIKIKSLTQGLDSVVVIDNPDAGNTTITSVFGLSIGGAPHTFNGDGPVTYIEAVHYNIDDSSGLIQRITGPVVLAAQATGSTLSGSDSFSDASPSIFLNVIAGDIISILSGPDAGDYRVSEVVNPNQISLDKDLTSTASLVNYSITRTGIKSGELVYVQYYYNPVSIDIGKYIALDSYGRVRGVRPGRDSLTITDLALLRVTSIEEIDPLTLEPTGFVLDPSGGYGQGPYGKGPYGVGSGSQWRLIVNKPECRFSMFEDSYLSLNGGLEGLSFRVNFDYVPEIESYHDFVRSPSERVLDGDTLMKHFIPAYVSGKIRYRVDSSNTNAPDNETLTQLVKDYINKRRAGSDLQISDVAQFVHVSADQFNRYTLYIEPFSLKAVIHNTDATITVLSSNSNLEIPTNTPIYSTRPLSARTAHWIADEIIMERIE